MNPLKHVELLQHDDGGFSLKVDSPLAALDLAAFMAKEAIQEVLTCHVKVIDASADHQGCAGLVEAVRYDQENGRFLVTVALTSEQTTSTYRTSQLEYTPDTARSSEPVTDVH